MEASILPPFSTKPSTIILSKPFTTTRTFLQPTLRPCPSRPLRVLNADDRKSSSGGDNTNDNNINDASQVEIRFRRGSRKRARQQQDTSGSLLSTPPPPPKDWDSMTIAEKAVELYVGERGLLFWLNKFAYASIFVVVGAWILFRFVGPSLGLYQLDSSPLPPSSIFKSSSP